MASELAKELPENGVYLTHLSEVNKSNSVIANQDIYNNDGALLVKKGTSINKNIADKIIKFKLLQPLENQVNIENDISGDRIYSSLQKRLKETPEIYEIHKGLDLDGLLKICCHHYSEQQILRQKLTVLHLRMPDVYKDSMTAGWLCMTIANQLKLTEDEINSAFIAGISHDIGMLHIDPKIITKPGELTPEEWRQIQAHVVIGQRILEHIPSLKPEIGKAVLEHHECCDGTGYPVGKFEAELGILGQIVGMADSVIAVYTRLRKKGKRLRDLIPIIQVNNKLHFYKTYDAIVRILRSAKLSEESQLESEAATNFINNVISKAQMLKECAIVYKNIIEKVSEQSEHRKVKAIEQVWEHILGVLKNSGIIEDCYIRWLHHVNEEKITYAYREAEDVGFMLQELAYHLQRLKRMLYLIIEVNTIIPTKVKEQLSVELEHVDKLQGLFAEKNY